MGGPSRERALERIRGASRAGLDVASFLDEVSRALTGAVANENHLDGPYWYTLDPESRLITSVYGGEKCELDTSEVMRWEYLDDDVNKYLEVLEHPRGVQTLHEVTGGRPETSRIYREYMAVEGIAQEMLVALRSRTGEPWGTVRLNRLPGQPEFDPPEAAFMALVAPDLAEGIRRGLLVGEARDPEGPDAPGLINVDANGEIVSLSASASRWVERLADGRASGPLPFPIASVAAAALSRRGTEGSVREPTVRVRSVDGAWVCVHGLPIPGGSATTAAVIVEPAHRDRIAPLLMAIHGLTPREQEVTRLVLKGCSTAQVADRLAISPHTVQQHLKGIFDKVGVRSRRELVAAVFFDSFDGRVQDNAARTHVGRPLRGGPRWRAR